MGNSSSRDGNLIIYIETDKSYYNSGSFIEGTVFVQAKKHFDFDALYLRVEGDEASQWFEGSSKNRQKFTGSQNFYAVQHLVQKYENTYLEPGKYAYPFSFELSENIPGSFESSQWDAKIDYKLAAYFVNLQKKDNREIEYIPIHVREPLRQEIISYQGTSTQKPKSCGCCSQGQVTLNSVFEKNVAYEGQTVNIDITVDNRQGTSDISKILVELVQNVFASSNMGNHVNHRDVIHSQTVKQQIPKGQVLKFPHQFTIPANIKQQTAIGTLVANHYRLEVSTQLSAISSDNPCVFAPIFILKKDFDLQNSQRPKGLSEDLKDYKQKKLQVFKAPEYWFKKNMNLSVMNFRLDQIDNV